MLYSRFNKFHFLQIFSYDIESLEELVNDSFVGFFVSKIFLSLYVLICPLFDSHKSFFLAVSLFLLPKQMMDFHHLASTTD